MTSNADAGTHNPPDSVERREFDVVKRDWCMLIDGHLRSASDGETLPVIHPGDGTIVAVIPNACADDVDDAVSAARKAAPDWAATSIHSRAGLLYALADAIERAGDELAWIDTIDNGSPITVMRNDYQMAIEQMRFFAGLAPQLRGETIPVADQNAFDFSRREPFGVVARLVPFNHPLMFAASKIAAPLLAGNTIVLKPSEHTSLTALRLGEIAADLLPHGVLNVVTGTGPRVGEPLVTHSDVSRVAFTGSEAVGRRILQATAAMSVKTVTLELGGKNPLLIFPDADLDAAVDGVLRGMNFTWQGQSCGSTSRLFVHRSIFDDVVTRVAERISAFKVGDPLLESTDVGPVVSEAHCERVLDFIDSGKRDPRLELLVGGERIASPGYFITPTLFSAIDGPHGALFRDEIFGPVLVAAPFDDYEHGLRLANELPFGLTASVWTSSLQTAMSASRDLQAGYVWVNSSSHHIPGAAFGGMKNSGLGREESLVELESYTQPKNVYIKF